MLDYFRCRGLNRSDRLEAQYKPVPVDETRVSRSFFELDYYMLLRRFMPLFGLRQHSHNDVQFGMRAVVVDFV